MITIEITTNDGESWTEPYHGSADQARSELVGSVVEFEPRLVTIVKVERVDRALT
jgi:hypothetical protein